jgi:hypothetical protein
VRAGIDLRNPGVEPVLEVNLVGEPAAGLDVGLGIALQALAVDARLPVPDQRARQAPKRSRQPAIPASTSSVCVENTRTPAPARE